MRHGVSGFKLKRNVAARNSLLRGLVTSVIESDFVITTVPKAKAVRPLVDKMITLAKDRHAAFAPPGRGFSPDARFGARSCSTSSAPSSGSATAATPASCGWAGAKAMAPNSPSSNWWAPNWSSAPPNAPSAAKNASRQFKKAVNTTKATSSQKNHKAGDQADRNSRHSVRSHSGSGHRRSLSLRLWHRSAFPNRIVCVPAEKQTAPRRPKMPTIRARSETRWSECRSLPPATNSVGAPPSVIFGMSLPPNATRGGSEGKYGNSA